MPSVTEEERNDYKNNSMLRWPAQVHSSSEAHGGEDVALMAQGPWVSFK
jgi:alkaline phosphatase